MSLLDVMPILDEEAEDREDEDGSVHMSEGGERESYEDLRLMLSELLDEKERLTQELNDKNDEMDEARLTMEDLEIVNKRLLKKLNSMPEKVKELYNQIDNEQFNPSLAKKTPLEEDYQKITKEYNNLLQELDLKDEDIHDLKAERANIKLLLEHLECLVARHEKVLRVTVVRRQQQPSGVSSEVEVLKALKSLFEHHKALDEKVRERCRKVTEEKQSMEEKLAHKDEECEALKSIVIAAQKDGNINGLISAADSNLLLSKCSKCEEGNKRLVETQDELEQRIAEMEDLYAQRDECLDRITEMDEEYNLISQDLDNSREIQKQLSNEVEQLHDAHEGLQIAYRELSEERDVLLGERDMIMASKSENTGSTVPISPSEYDEMKKKLESYNDLEQELNVAKKHLAKVREEDDKVTRLSETIEVLLQESNTQQQTFREEKQSLINARNGLQDELETLRAKSATFEEEKASLLVELQGLRAVNAELLKYNKTKVGTTGPFSATQSEGQHTAEERVSDNNRNNRPSLKIPPNNATPVTGSNNPNTPTATQLTPTATRRSASVGRSSSFTKRRDLERRGSTDATKYNETMVHNHTESEILDNEFNKNFFSSDIYNQGKYIPLDRDITKKKASPKSLRKEASTKATVESLEGELKDAFEDLLSLHPPEEGGTENKPEQNGPNGDVGSIASDSGESFSNRDSMSSAASLESSRSSSNIPHSRSSSEIVDLSLDDIDLDGSDTLRRKRNTGGSLKGTIKRVFGKRKSDPIKEEESSPVNKENDRRWKTKQQLYLSARKRGLPFALWNPDMILAWLEVYVGAPAWLVTTCRSRIRSGAAMSALSDNEIQREMGITSYLHRLKIRLAIQEMVNQTSPSAPVGLPSFERLTHSWVADTWLPSIGLPQHRTLFMENLVDGRMLSHLTKKDLRQTLKFADPFHRTSFYFAVEMLKKLNYNMEEIDRRRVESKLTKTDVMVWTNQRVKEWLHSVGFGVYANNITNSGVHGPLIACHTQFTAEEFADLLHMPKEKPELRRVLSNEFNLLLSCGTERGLMEETPEKAVVMRSNRSKSWRKKNNRASMAPSSASVALIMNKQKRVGLSSLSSVSGSFFDVEKTLGRFSSNQSLSKLQNSSPRSSRESLSSRDVTNSASSREINTVHRSHSSLALAPERSPGLPGHFRRAGSTTSLTSKNSVRMNQEHSSDDRKVAQVSMVAPRKIVSVRRVPSATSLSQSPSPVPSASSDDRTIPANPSPYPGTTSPNLEQLMLAEYDASMGHSSTVT
ncbi:hypothetical protein ACHWQZ_G001441 [Mnemiopsis leidyi]